MTINNANQNGLVLIGPGEIYTSTGVKVIKTLLGSCVAACLYDPVNQVYGMNHFLLSVQKAKSKTTILNSREGYYGIHAMELLINSLLKKGAERQHLKAKIFGGGNVLRQFSNNQQSFYDIGRYNIEFVIDYLKNERIPIVASSVGSDYGRIIFFDPVDFSVYQKRISHAQEESLAIDELRYVETKRHNSGQVQIW